MEVTPAQQEFVTAVSRYLALCHYEGLWQPLAVCRDEDVIGFLMWAVDPVDGSCWLGGIQIDHRQQGQGYGRAAVQAALALLAGEFGHRHFALSYNPANVVAQRLYHSLGFVETGEWEDDEMVARMIALAAAEKLTALDTVRFFKERTDAPTWYAFVRFSTVTAAKPPDREMSFPLFPRSNRILFFVVLRVFAPLCPFDCGSQLMYAAIAQNNAH